MVAFGEELKTAPFVKSSEYLTKEQAAKIHTDVIGEDFMTFLGANPLQNSYDIHLKADYIDRANIEKIERRFRANEMVSDVVYDKQLVNLVNDNIQKISMWILIISRRTRTCSGVAYQQLDAIVYLLQPIHHQDDADGGRDQIVYPQAFHLEKHPSWFHWRCDCRARFVGHLYYLDLNYPNLKITEDQPLIALVLLGVLVVGILIS
jgi:cell division transport system permease protein